MAAKNSCIYIQYTYFWLKQKLHCVIYVRTFLSRNKCMERRLTANKALERVLDYAYSSGEESEIEEDFQFPLPVPFSDDESFTLPGSPTSVVNSYAPLLQAAGTCARVATSMAVPILPEAAPPTSPAGMSSAQTNRGAGVCSRTTNKFICMYMIVNM